MEMLPAKRGRPEYRTDAERERDAHNAAKRNSKATLPMDVARRHGKQVEAMAKLDHELPELQEDLELVKHKCRFMDPKRTGDLDLKIYTWTNRTCDMCNDRDKDARFITAEAAASKDEDLCPHAFCFECADNWVFGAAAIAARTVQYHAPSPAGCPVCPGPGRSDCSRQGSVCC